MTSVQSARDHRWLFHAQYCDKKYYDILIIFRHRLQSRHSKKDSPKLFVMFYACHLYLGWTLEQVAKKYQIIEMFYYLFIAILYMKMSCIISALSSYRKLSQHRNILSFSLPDTQTYWSKNKANENQSNYSKSRLMWSLWARPKVIMLTEW